MAGLPNVEIINPGRGALSRGSYIPGIYPMHIPRAPRRGPSFQPLTFRCRILGSGLRAWSLGSSNKRNACGLQGDSWDPLYSRKCDI